MYKLIGIILAAAPIVLFLRAILKGQLKKRSQGLSDFKKQMDYLVWAILFFIGMWSCLLDREVILPIFDMMDDEGDRLTPGTLGKRLPATPAAALAGVRRSFRKHHKPT